MKDDRVYLLHVRDAFAVDRKTQDAVVRNLEIIGEAVKRVSDAAKDAHRDLPWRQIAGMRDKLIHDYFGVDLDLVWEVVDRHLPLLRERIETMLAEV